MITNHDPGDEHVERRVGRARTVGEDAASLLGAFFGTRNCPVCRLRIGDSPCPVCTRSSRG